MRRDGAKRGVVAKIDERTEEHALQFAHALLRVEEVNVAEIGVAAHARNGDDLCPDELDVMG